MLDESDQTPCDSVTVAHHVLQSFKSYFPNYQTNTYSLWPSIRLLESSMTLQQRTGSLEPWKPQETCNNLLQDMGSNHQQCLTFGPSTKTLEQRKIVHIQGIHPSFWIMHNDWWYETASRIVRSLSNRLHKIWKWTSASMLFEKQQQTQDTTNALQGRWHFSLPFRRRSDSHGKEIRGLCHSSMEEPNMVRRILCSSWWP